MAITQMIVTPTHQEIICSCGHHSMEPHHLFNMYDITRVRELRCPDCQNLAEKMYYSGRSWNSNNEDKILPDIDITITSHCAFNLKVTRYHFVIENDYLKKNDEMRLVLTKKDEAELDVDIIRNPAVIMKMNGNSVPPTKSNITKALSFVTVSSVPGTIFEPLAKAMGTTTLAAPVVFLKDHPYFEKFFPLDPRMHSYQALQGFLDLLDSTKKKPQQILGLTKPQYELYMPHIAAFSACGMTFEKIQVLQKKFSEKDMEKLLEMSWELAVRQAKTSIPSGWAQILLADFVEYDLDQLFRYLTDSLYTYQGISNVYDGTILLFDYLDMSNKMNVAFEKYPKSLKLRHDLAMKNYKVLLSAEQTKKFLQAVSEEAYKRLTFVQPDYSVIIPEKPEDVVYEGSYLSHCVGSYIDKIANEKVKILFLRKTGREGKPLVTLDVRGNSLTQAAGCGNRRLSAEEAAFVKKWAAIKKLVIETLL